MHFVDYYDILGLNSDVPKEQIVEAYNALTEKIKSGKHHANYERLVGINIAYLILTDPKSRVLYDLDYAENMQRNLSIGSEEIDRSDKSIVLEENRNIKLHSLSYRPPVIYESLRSELNSFLRKAKELANEMAAKMSKDWDS